MTNRFFNEPEGYRYAFNGMEKDNELLGNGNSYTTEFRQYDPRIARWSSLDPLMSKYPHQGPYSAFNNNPIYFADPTGLKGDPPGDSSGEEPCGSCGKGETKIQMATRMALVTLAQTYNVKKGLSLDDTVKDSEVTAPQLFYQWVMGTGKSKRTFNENSTMGKQMLEAKEVVEGIDDAIYNFDQKLTKTTDFARSLSKENQKIYPVDFAIDLENNPARAFHGSYAGKITVTRTEETTLGTYYYLNIVIVDHMTATSGTRKPPSMGGYEKNSAIFSDVNPYGPNGNFRTIDIKYNMNIKVFEYNTLGENAKKFFNYLTH